MSSHNRTRAWTLLAIDGPRQHAGNDGYADSPATTYRYDSGVGNGRQIQKGDLAFIRDRHQLLGIAILDRISSTSGEKKLLRCPTCNSSKLRNRLTVEPKFRCHRGHTFDDPIVDMVRVELYQAHYENSFIPVYETVLGRVLKQAALRPSAQNSIEEVDPIALADYLTSVAPASRPLFEKFFQKFSVNDLPAEVLPDPEFVPQLGDRRIQTLAAIYRRQGQRDFRNGLIKRYGPKCAISACTIMQIVEAAHIWPYRGTDDNHPENGLLLRADLHTLYDLNLIGIDEDMKVNISPQLMGTEYETYYGQILSIPKPLSRTAISWRWKSFIEFNALTLGKSG